MIPIRDSHPSRSFPAITVAIIAINAAIFLFEQMLDDYSQNHFVSLYAMIPARFRMSTLITSMFLHGGWMHIIGNMWFLWIFGDNVEDILGKFKYVLFYLGCGAAAGLTHLAFNLDSRIPTVGASGAIAGVMGAYLLKFPHSKITTLIPIFIFFTTVDIPAWIMLAYWFVIQLASGVGDIATMHVQRGGVAWFAHVGGFLAGVILIKIFRTNERYRRHAEYRW
jgi:membrane associated rhomboid family serine protease